MIGCAQFIGRSTIDRLKLEERFHQTEVFGSPNPI